MRKSFAQKSAPFIHTERTTKYMYFCLLIALIPPITFSVFYYGIRAVILILFCAFFSSLIQGFKDYSAPVHGVVFALLLPANASLISASIGVLVSELLLKKMFGGPGSNIVYPAAFSRLFVELLIPQDLLVSSELGEEWLEVKSLISIGLVNKRPIQVVDYSFSEVLAGRFPTYMGTGCAVLILFGMFFIWHTHATRMATPIAYLLTVFAVKLMLNINGSFVDIGMFMMTSGVVFVATYILTDPTNTAQFGASALAEGIICGLATALISLRTSGIIMILVPVLLVGLMDGSIRFYCGLLEKERLGRTVK